MIYVTNWHTPYTIMLSKIFESMIVCGDWDYDQRDLPEGCDLISFSDIPYDKIMADDIFIFNHAPSDLISILRTFLFTRAKMVLVVHGELNRVGNNVIKRFVKKVFYRGLGALFVKRGGVVCIQEKVKKSYGFSQSAVSIEPFYADPGVANEFKKNDRFVLVANSFRREHFNKSVPKAIKNLGFDVDLIGRDNDDFKDDFNLITPSNQSEYFAELSKGGVFLNVLTPPEAPYNLSLLDAIGVGLPIVEVSRPDSVILAPIESIDASRILTSAKVEDWLTQASLDTDANKSILRSRFSIELFEQKWKEVVGFDFD